MRENHFDYSINWRHIWNASAFDGQKLCSRTWLCKQSRHRCTVIIIENLPNPLIKVHLFLVFSITLFESGYSLIYRIKVKMWWRLHRNLPENRCTPLIRALMRQQPQKVLESACKGASAAVPSISIPRVRTLADQLDCGSDFVYSPVRCTWGHALPLSAFRVALHLLVRRLSHPAVPSFLLHLRVGHC